MEIKDIKDWFEVSQEESLQDGSELKCPKCLEWSSHKKWEETSVYCEDCGEHMAIRCPNCDEVFDYVYSKYNPFECRVFTQAN